MRPDEYKQAASRKHAAKQRQQQQQQQGAKKGSEHPAEKKMKIQPDVAPQPTDHHSSAETAEHATQEGSTSNKMTEEEKIKLLQAEEDKWIQRTLAEMEESQRQIDIAQRQLASVPPAIDAHPFAQLCKENKEAKLSMPLWHSLYDPPDVASSLAGQHRQEPLQLDYSHLQKQLEKSEVEEFTQEWENSVKPSHQLQQLMSI